MKPLHLQLALSAIDDGLSTIRAGQVDAGARLIEHGADYLRQFTEQPNIVRGAVARAYAVLRSQRTHQGSV